MIKQSDNSLRKILRDMIPGLFVLTVLAFLVSLFWGFKLSILIGFSIGFVYVVLSYFYMAETISRAVKHNKKTAQRMMFGCYLLRYILLILICAIAFKTEVFNVFGVLIPQLFPRIVLMFNSFRERKAVLNDESSADE